MTYEIVTAQFSSCDEVNHALAGLHQAGLIRHGGDLSYAGGRGRPKLHLSVPPEQADRVTAVLRRFGGCDINRF